MIAAQWDRRIQRADELIAAYPSAAEGLRFYARIATFQRNLYLEFHERATNRPEISSERALRDDLAFAPLLPRFSDFLALIGEIAPQPLAQAANAISGQASLAQEQILRRFWLDDLASFGEDGARQNQERLLAWLFLQPYAEHLAEPRARASIDGTPLTCPLCGAKPIVGVLRREGDGARKSLVCMLCAYEWAFRRIYCPACGEEREPQMGFYAAPEIVHVRVDVCDTCHTYLKTVDLTKLGLAVPVVDELATIPLDLWAREHGYQKLQINLLGV